jgi:hypothetical protein
MEEWREIPGFDGRYEASSLGRIRSTGRPHPQRTRTGAIAMVFRRERVLKLGKKGLGYFNVELAGKSHAVSRLVCLAFNGPCPDGLDCAHLNGNSSDNRPENLKWATRSENMLHRRDHGTSSKLSDSQVIEIYRRRKAKEPAKALAREFGIHPETVFKIGNGRLRSHVTKALS